MSDFGAPSWSEVVLDCHPTITSLEQDKAENEVINCFKAFLNKKDGEPEVFFMGNKSEDGHKDDIFLEKELHCNWLKRGLLALSPSFKGLDASRPWFVYWISHALEVLGDYDESLWASRAASFIGRCQHTTGGFAGGPGQLAHLAPTYAAVSALVIAGSETAYKVVDRELMYRFLMRMKCPEGGFRMHEEGETDIRGSYCAMAVASMLHMLTDELMEGLPDYIRRCQTWEGGLAGEAGLEAHGGYSYCGLAALCIIGKADALDLFAFLRWAAHKQMSHEGGFQGRANKLVDSCYAFWMGGIFPLLHEAFRQSGQDVALPLSHSWFAPSPLQTYVFLACQTQSGGLRDKPGKSADFYHSCYSLSGVSVSQHGVDGSLSVVGAASNLLERTDLYYNVLVEKAERKCAYFAGLPPLEVDGRVVGGGEGVGAAEGRRHLLEELNLPSYQ